MILDADLALFYGVSTKRLNEQVKRNNKRFPSDFMFRLTDKEKKEVVAICDHLPGLKYSPGLPYAFTEHGTLMAASVLNSERAVSVSLFIVRAFVRLRTYAAHNRELMRRLETLERHVAGHDEHIVSLVQAIRKLAEPRSKSSPAKIGFIP